MDEDDFHQGLARPSMHSRVSEALPRPIRGVEVRLPSHKVLRAHLSVVAALVTAGLTGHLVHYFTGHDYVFGLRPLFNLNAENNVPSIFSGLAILGCAVILFVLYFRYKATERSGSTFFMLFGFLFVYLACDETFSFHEKLTDVGSRMTDASGIFYFVWVVPGSLLAFVVFLCSLGFLYRTDSRTRNLMVLSGAIFVGGALGVEALSGWRIDTLGINLATVYGKTPDLGHFLLSTVEEAMEMLGIALFAYALLLHHERHFGTLVLRSGRAAAKVTEPSI